MAKDDGSGSPSRSNGGSGTGNENDSGNGSDTANGSGSGDGSGSPRMNRRLAAGTPGSNALVGTAPGLARGLEWRQSGPGGRPDLLTGRTLRQPQLATGRHHWSAERSGLATDPPRRQVALLPNKEPVIPTGSKSSTMNGSTASSSQRGGPRDKKIRKQLEVTSSSHGGAATRAEKKMKKKTESLNQRWEEEVKQRQATYRHPTFDMMHHFLDFSNEKTIYNADFEAKEASEASRMADNCIVFDSRGNVLLRKFSSSYGLKKDAQQKLAEITDRLVAAYPPPKSGAEDGRLPPPKERETSLGAVQKSGGYHFRSALVGQTSDTADYSTPITGIFGPVCSFLLDLDHANQVLTGMLEYFEPDMFLEYREAIETLPPDRKVLYTGTSDKGVWCDRVVRINKNTHCHRELRDRKDGFSFMFTVGKFEGGDLCLPKLKLRIPFGSGSVIMLRSALLEHFVCPWEGDCRYQFTYSTHQDIFDWARDYKYASQKYNRR